MILMITRNRNSILFTLIIFLLLLIILLMGIGVINITPRAELPETKRVNDGAVVEDFAYQGNKEVTAEGAGFTADEIENIRVYEHYNKAVVNIATEVVGYNWFLEPVPRKGSSGSGSIFDERGYVLTNNHVVENAYKVYITLAGGVLFEGEVVGTDPENDLAVIYFDPGSHPLATIPFGNSNSLKVGQKVLAIGNPFAFERTLTTGIISGLGRPLKNDKGILIRDLIQTDASINPGNSGGPLLNAHGELIGVNTMIYTPSGGSVGIGFAVPAATARRIVPDLIKYGFVQRGWIDIDPVPLFPSLVRYAKLPVAQGVLVSQVEPNGNAAAAGLRGGSPDQVVRSGESIIYLGGDIIVGIDDESVASIGDFYAALEQSRPGDVVSVRVIRNRREHTLNITLDTRTGETD